MFLLQQRMRQHLTMKNPINLRYLLKHGIFFYLALVTPFKLFALASDKQQPATMLADSLTYNKNTGIGVYTGHVQITQGTTKITANQITTYSDKNNNITKAIATGTPATYTSQTQANQPPMQATAATIQYFPDKQLVLLIGNAVVTQKQNVLKSPWISYDMKNNMIVTSNNKAAKQRTTIILQPQATQKNQ